MPPKRNSKCSACWAKETMKAFETKKMTVDELSAIIVQYTQGCDALQHLPDNSVEVVLNIDKFLLAIHEYHMHFTEVYLGCLAAVMYADSFPHTQDVLEDKEFIYDPSGVGRWDMHVVKTRLRIEALALTIKKLTQNERKVRLI